MNFFVAGWVIIAVGCAFRLFVYVERKRVNAMSEAKTLILCEIPRQLAGQSPWAFEDKVHDALASEMSAKRYALALKSLASDGRVIRSSNNGEPPYPTVRLTADAAG
jgi:hypothetical protein